MFAWWRRWTAQRAERTDVLLEKWGMSEPSRDLAWHYWQLFKEQCAAVIPISVLQASWGLPQCLTGARRYCSGGAAGGPGGLPACVPHCAHPSCRTALSAMPSSPPLPNILAASLPPPLCLPTASHRRSCCLCPPCNSLCAPSLQMLVLAIFFQMAPAQAGLQVMGLVCAIFGLMAFLEGLRVCIMVRVYGRGAAGCCGVAVGCGVCASVPAACVQPQCTCIGVVCWSRHHTAFWACMQPDLDPCRPRPHGHRRCPCCSPLPRSWGRSCQPRCTWCLCWQSPSAWGCWSHTRSPPSARCAPWPPW